MVEYFKLDNQNEYLMTEKELTVKWYSECRGCGAMTIFFNDGTHKSVFKKYIKDNGIDLTKAVRLTMSYHCENCFPIEKAIEHMMQAK